MCGEETSNGLFDVDDYCFADLTPVPLERPMTQDDRYGVHCRGTKMLRVDT